MGDETTRAAESVVRSLSTAAKTLRLYPPTSPIPMQAMEGAVKAVADGLAGEPTFALVVARDGFTHRGHAVNAMAGNDLAGLLTSHEVAQVDFLPGCNTSDVAAFLTVLLREPADVRAEGGTAAALALAGAETIVVSHVALTTASVEMEPGADIDSFLRELAEDESKLSAWLAAAASGDPAALADGLAELARAVGPNGLARLQSVLGTAFTGQDVKARDVIVGLALETGFTADLVKDTLRSLQPTALASSLADGMFAKNMLSMSNVLNTLSLGPELQAIIDELKPMLAEDGHADREISFLVHMLDARSNPAGERPLTEREAEYATVARLTNVDGSAIDAARGEVRSSEGSVNKRTVGMMLSLLDQQRDFNLWSKTLSNLAAIVPTLMADRDLALADRVFADLSSREARTTQPWPGLADQMVAAFERATSAEAMGNLVSAVLDDPSQLDAAKSILRRVGPPAQQRFVLAALKERERDGIGMAERLLGRRLLDLLVGLQSELPWFQVGAVAARLATESDQQCRDALMALASRPEERSRQEVARGLSDSSAATAVTVLSELAGDDALEVAATAVRSLGRSEAIGAAAALGRLYENLDATGKDFPLAREVLGALARTPDTGAVAILERIAGHRVLIKRGHFSELQELARQALASRKSGGALP